MITAIKGFFSWLAGHIYGGFSYLFSLLYVVWYQLWASFIEWLDLGVSWLKSLLPSGLVEFFSNPLLAGAIATAAESITFFIPLAGLMTVVVFTYSTVASIRLARWIKSFVPTISG